MGVTLQQGTAVWVSRFNGVRLCGCHASTGYDCVGVTLQRGAAVKVLHLFRAVRWFTTAGYSCKYVIIQHGTAVGMSRCRSVQLYVSHYSKVQL